MTLRTGLLMFSCLLVSASIGRAQLPDGQPQPATPEGTREVPVPQTVDVEPASSDDAIESRIEEILSATGWFTDPGVEVKNGVVFLTGATTDEAHREKAELLAQRTQDVVAVVNSIRLLEPPLWDLTPAGDAVRQLLAETIQTIPMLGIGLLVVVLFWVFAKVVAYLSQGMVQRRIESELLQQVLLTALVVVLVLVGIYVALRVTDLTRLAMTLVGGTGLVGLALGFAFRDIAENFLASILISLNHPFRIGDLVEVEGRKGYVQRVTTRGTLLMTIAGDHVQIPNSTVYKSILINYTSNQNSQFSFVVGIGYDDDVLHAQQILHGVLQDHPAVLDDPPPSVLVDLLGPATVNIKCLFWVDISQHSFLKVCSALMRQAKIALQSAGVSMPDESREVLFPQGVPVRMLAPESEQPSGGLPTTPGVAQRKVPAATSEPNSSDAEGQLGSEAAVIRRQSALSHHPDDAPSLVK